MLLVRVGLGLMVRVSLGEMNRVGLGEMNRVGLGEMDRVGLGLVKTSQLCCASVNSTPPILLKMDYPNPPQ